MKLELTPARQKIIDEASKEWLGVGLSTNPADFESAEKAVGFLYNSIGKKKPHIVRLSSPFAAEIYLNLLTAAWPSEYNQTQLRSQLSDQLRGQLWSQPSDQLSDQLWGQLSDQLWGQLSDQLWGQLRGQLSDQLRSQLSDQDDLKYFGTWFSGSWDSYLWGWGDASRRIGAVYSYDLNESLDAHCHLSKSVGWLYPSNDFCILTDRPEIIKLDNEGRLHNEDGPALRYRDGYSLYSWHGVRVPHEWIEQPESLTAKTAITWANIEQRRVACEIIGWDNALNQLELTVVDTDSDPEIGELVEVSLPDVGREKFLRVLCGTGRRFALPVPPDMETALEANAWTYGFEVSDFIKPEVRT